MRRLPDLDRAVPTLGQMDLPFEPLYDIVCSTHAIANLALDQLVVNKST
jgi:hypothetical protein